MLFYDFMPSVTPVCIFHLKRTGKSKSKWLHDFDCKVHYLEWDKFKVAIAATIMPKISLKLNFFVETCT